MYYCYNCRQSFDTPLTRYQPYPNLDYGGEYYTVCPHCKSPEMYEQREVHSCRETE